MHTRARPLAFLLFSLGAVAACSRKPAARAPDPTSTVDADRARRDSIAADSARRAADARARAEREAAERLAAERERLEGVRRTLTESIYFEFDRDDLGDAARRTLDAKAVLLQQNPALRLRVSGHTDERGSDEYNLALGQRRAAAAVRYLTARGIADARLETASLGEEQPVCGESADACWSRNRRDEFSITAGIVAGRP